MKTIRATPPRASALLLITIVIGVGQRYRRATAGATAARRDVQFPIFPDVAEKLAYRAR